MSKNIDRRTLIQRRDHLLSEYKDLRKNKNPFENLEVMEAVLASNVNLLSNILGHSFNIFRGEVEPWDEAPENMYTLSKEE